MSSKTKYKVEVIEDSINAGGKRLVTLACRYPRIIHSEFMTHRVNSRNASSSRAIPTEKMLSIVTEDPAMPARFGENQKGMQDKGADHGAPVIVHSGFDDLLIQWEIEMAARGEPVRQNPCALGMDAEEAWRFSAWVAAQLSKAFSDAGYHKQVANRITEPYQWINVLVTATEWDNFFALRDHEDADPTIQVLARSMREAMAASTPVFRSASEWHMPYISYEERRNLPLPVLLKCSTARCARVSYKTFEGKTPTVEEDLKLYDRLVSAVPQHMSPTEHQAMAQMLFPSNFVGWTQHRKYIELHQPIY